MTISTKQITGAAWVVISAPGESGTCWLREFPEGQIAIVHSSSGVPTGDAIDDSYFMEKDYNKILDLSADDSADIFYARCTGADDTAILIVDIV